jgi:hypothetical protein
MGRYGVSEEDAGFAPGNALGKERELLAGEGMKGMSDGENLSPIQVIGRS